MLTGSLPVAPFSSDSSLSIWPLLYYFFFFNPDTLSGWSRQISSVQGNITNCWKIHDHTVWHRCAVLPLIKTYFLRNLFWSDCQNLVIKKKKLISKISPCFAFFLSRSTQTKKLELWQPENCKNFWRGHAVGGSLKDPDVWKLPKLKQSIKDATLTLDHSFIRLVITANYSSFVIYSFVASAADRYLWQCP